MVLSVEAVQYLYLCIICRGCISTLVLSVVMLFVICMPGRLSTLVQYVEVVSLPYFVLSVEIVFLSLFCLWRLQFYLGFISGGCVSTLVLSVEVASLPWFLSLEVVPGIISSLLVSQPPRAAGDSLPGGGGSCWPPLHHHPHHQVHPAQVGLPEGMPGRLSTNLSVSIVKMKYILSSIGGEPKVATSLYWDQQDDTGKCS
jgi:hypothetical protein